MEFTVTSMSCGHCAGVITEAVKSLDPQAKVSVDLASKKVVIDSSQNREVVAAALNQAGYATH